MSIDDLSRFLIVAAPIEWFLTFYAYQLAHRFHENSLWFLFGVFAVCAVIVSIGASLGAANLLGIDLPDGVGTASLTIIFILCAAIPPSWFVGFLMGKFR